MSSDFGKQSIKNRRERYAVRGNDRASPLGFRSSPSASPAENVSPYSGKVQPLRNYARRAWGVPERGWASPLGFSIFAAGASKKKRHARACLFFWRRHPDLNRGSRICSPMPYHLAMAPKNGAGNEIRTRYLHLGKVALCQMSYARKMVPPVGIEPTTRGFSVPCSTN